MSRFKVFAVLVLLLAVPALMFAQQAQQSDQQAQAGQQSGDFVRLQDAMSMQVASSDNSVQGTIKDFVLSQTGDISHVAIQTQDGQTYLVPADQIQFQGQQAMLQASQDQIKQFQAMQGDQLPQEVAMDHYLASKLQGFTLVDQAGQELGQVQGAMLDLQNKRIDYLGVAPSGQLGLSQALYAVPTSDIQQINADQNQITSNITADQFGQLQGFSQDSWPQQAMGGAMAPAGQQQSQQQSK